MPVGAVLAPDHLFSTTDAARGGDFRPPPLLDLCDQGQTPSDLDPDGRTASLRPCLAAGLPCQIFFFFLLDLFLLSFGIFAVIYLYESNGFVHMCLWFLMNKSLELFHMYLWIRFCVYGSVTFCM
jgi:hypothetical protein